MRLTVCTVLLVLAFCSGPVRADGLAVVDVERIFRESTPGKAGEAHLTQARDILLKGLDELRAIYKGMEEKPEAKAALREGQAALDRQFAADRLAVWQVLTAHLEHAIRIWFGVNAQGASINAVAPASALFVYSPALDVTDAVMREMDKEKPTFHALPTVTVKANPQATPGKDAITAPAQPAARRKPYKP